MTDRTNAYAAIHVELCCSRCTKITWDSETGNYNEKCDDGTPCDIKGAVYFDGERQER